MKFNSSKMFFFAFMIVGVMMCISTNNWIMIWCGLEIVLVSFMPLMISKMILSSESSMKYFLVQSISSAMLILGLMLMLMNENFNKALVTLAITLKMGVAPLHTWLISITEGLTFNSNMILLTLLKLPPITMMTYINTSMMMIAMITILVGSLSGLIQPSTRKLMAYSSIFNIGLILSCMKQNMTWLTYFLIYSILILIVMNFMSKMNMNYLNQMIINDKSLGLNISMWFFLLSMGGLPPLMGFTIKLMVIEFMISKMMILNLILIIACSLLVMFFYMRITFLALMFLSSKLKPNLNNSSTMSTNLSLINLMTLPLILTMKSLT
uniref:NADH dehydrogenase subunit 2 n=1 Tax=Trifida elongata TaxID=2929027 RepID=UPI0020007F81|nr:NADH dehydrogenase subunit 2 [Trifida elongata]UNS15666.1 NADH dehydrogenase subunit 2 [Trifida elongata]